MGIYDSVIKDAQSAIDFNEFEKFELQSQKSNRELSAGQILWQPQQEQQQQQNQTQE